MKHTLKAFTLTELLVGMIISAIVIGFGYESYTLIYRQYLTFKKVKKELVNTVQLNSLMNNDFINAAQVYFQNNKLSLSFLDHSPVTYEFEDSMILRTDAEVTDTFKLAPVNIVAKRAIETDENPLMLIDGLTYDSKILGETEHFVITKNYSAETLMNRATAN